MPGFISWITRLFGAHQVPPVHVATESRLLNPATKLFEDSEMVNRSLRNLERHLFCWLLDTTPSRIEKPSPHSPMVLEEIGLRIHKRQLDELPRQPLTLPMLMRALSDESTDRSELTKIILADPALTDQLLQMANSPFFRHGDHPAIESVDKAVFVLGIDGIRNVISAAVMRPMLSARHSSEALFAQRVWRWGLSCARSAELIARMQGVDSSAYFLAGLIPSLAYITLRREVQRVYRLYLPGQGLDPAAIKDALIHYDWPTSQLLANDWDLPPRYHAHLLAAERPAPGQQHTPLNDGMLLGTREILRHAHQRNMAEDDLRNALMLSDEQFNRVRHSLLTMLHEGITHH